MFNISEEFVVRFGTIDDIDQIFDNIQRIKIEMSEQKIAQWPLDKDYPSKEMIKTDLLNSQYFILEKNKEYAGSVVLNTITTPPYSEISWNGKHFLAVHRLATVKAFRKDDAGQLLMSFAEEWALAHHQDSIRLDTYSHNRRANKFYQSCGFTQVGKISLPWMPEQYYCYEKLLSVAD
ncbi:GNAT family N-acetyltransferase [Persicobacter psychrovividus]|uniref:N-acetyltransferase n=1 Tax=Persicobacter psychrovividus TaxID=387638 RepID=A0ABN6LIU0_9BACT|nr:N-acetyltransferase [Persicobacter psychrovividus]